MIKLNTENSHSIKDDLHYLPADYRKVVSDALKCHPNMVGIVHKILKEEDHVMLTSHLQIKIIKCFMSLITSAKQTEKATNAKVKKLYPKQKATKSVQTTT